MALTPAEAVARAKSGSGVIGWKLDRGERGDLLQHFPPRYASADADHVTLKAKVAGGAALPGDVTAAIVGQADDGRGVEAMVVAVDGSTDRPGGGTYHITWSLGPGRQARESNDVLAQGTWQSFPEPIPVTLTPARLR